MSIELVPILFILGWLAMFIIHVIFQNEEDED